MRISDWSSDVCSSDLAEEQLAELEGRTVRMQELQKVPGPDLVRRREQQTVLARDVGILIGFRPARVGRRDVLGRRHALVGRPRNNDVGRDRKSVGKGKSVTVRGGLAGCRIITKKKQ